MVITIIVMLILTTVTITTIQGEGLIGKAREVNFRTEIAQIRGMIEQENASLGGKIQTESTELLEEIPISEAEAWSISLKKEIIYWGIFSIETNKPTDSYIEEEFKKAVQDGEEAYDIYYINTGKKGEENKYIYNRETDIIYKIKPTRIYGKAVHSIEELDYIKNGGERNKPKEYTKIEYEAQWKNNLGYYEPDINKFGKEVTSLIFYKQNTNNEEETSTITEEIYEMPASEWLDKNRPNTIEIEENENKSTYILYDYENRIWANIKVESSGIETWWVWIPRYAYKNDGTTTTIEFIDNNNKTVEGEDIPEGYTVQAAFQGNTKKGILVSKYQPTNESKTESTEFAYYIPDLTGFDENNTYLEIYNKEEEVFESEVKLSEITNLSKFSKDNLWYDYDNKIWANVKVEINGIETWWVWIPRYAYRNDSNTTEIIFLDKNNKPLNGGDLPNTYTVQAAFQGNKKKGIWVSKYQPSAVSNTYTTNLNTKTIPDLTGFIKSETYLQIYDKNEKKFTEEVQLSKISDIETWVQNNLWYDYSKRIYANIKVVKNNIETWWVWIPRYAYRNDNTITDVILIDENNKQLDGKDLPSTYTIQSAFQGNTKKGIWVSKYQPTEN